ncbi:MAG: hypothetical protein RJA59_116 [Pseudomonadota bacterium]
MPDWQLPPGHWLSNAQDGFAGGNGEHWPNWQLPPGHSLSNAQDGLAGGNGEHRPNWQFPPGHWLSNAQVSRSAAPAGVDCAMGFSPGVVQPLTSRLNAAIEAKTPMGFISYPSGN